MTGAAVIVDGRARRAARTRDAVVEAILSLIGEGILRPTARQLSGRAGVSLRSVFQHFDDLESLFATAAEMQIARVMSMVEETRTTDGMPLPQRIAAFVGSRAKL